MFKATPGPWAVSGQVRAAVIIGDQVVRLGVGDTANADARLIEAAPDMLAALRVAEQFMSVASDWGIDEAEINGEMRSTYDWCAIVSAAIAKATGEAR